MTDFGASDARHMPAHFFSDAVSVDYATAMLADVDRQNFSVCPRHWYVDATFACDCCGTEFVFAAGEQMFWYEELGFWVGSRPTRCTACRVERRRLKSLRQEYDREIEQSLACDAAAEQKRRLLEIVNELVASGVALPERMLQRRAVLENQLERSTRTP